MSAAGSFSGSALGISLLGDPIVLVEMVSLLFLSFYLFSVLYRKAVSASHREFGVGAFISEPKRSLQRQCH